uniref:Uncharacterized protein n=1 Tax=Ditylenchus dipsaci TaxID=166011 RepID=A0A915EIW2_9BILA
MDWTHAFVSNKTTATSMTLNVGGNVKCGFLDIDNIMGTLTPETILSKQNLFETTDFVLLDTNLRDDSTALWLEPTNFLKVHKIFGKDALGKRLI